MMSTARSPSSFAGPERPLRREADPGQPQESRCQSGTGGRDGFENPPPSCAADADLAGAIVSVQVTWSTGPSNDGWKYSGNDFEVALTRDLSVLVQPGGGSGL